MTINNFISNRIAEDVSTGKTPNVVLRFPPEPNGFLHLGHVKSIVLNSLLAEEFGAELNLRFDDTNPKKESFEYVEAIKRDVAWLSSNFTNIMFASDYFETIYRCAIHLIENGLAYVDTSSPDVMKDMRGGFGKPGIESPDRLRTPDENLALFGEMKSGNLTEGSCVLRAKIDMAHPNINMRDPVIYRISHTEHHNTGFDWCIYPLYDFAHPISDAIERITHSLCTLEFEDHRPLYDWVINNCFDILNARPTQIEFARLDVEGVVLSKRKLNTLVTEGLVTGWDSPCMPTVSGLRTRGFTPEILRAFVERCGFTKTNTTMSASILDETVCDVLGPIVERRIAVLDPVELVITNHEEAFTIDVPFSPKDATKGTRKFTLTPSVWIDRSDVRAEAEEGFWRAYPGNWVRLKHGLNVLITRVEVDNGHVRRVYCEADHPSRNIKAAKHKAKTTLHWLGTYDTVPLTIDSYVKTSSEAEGLSTTVAVRSEGLVERGLEDDTHYEFERSGYYYFKAGVAHKLAALKAPGKK